MKKADILVVGAGITGLRVAALLAENYGISPLVVSEDVGGLISCYRERGFLFDFGGHVYTNKDPQVVEMMQALKAEEHVRHAVYNKFGVGDIPYPVQDHADKLGIEITGVPYKFNPKQDLEDLIMKTFGRPFYDGFFEPFTQRVWTVSSRDMATDWIIGRIKLPEEKKEGWGLNDTFRYAPGDQIASYLRRKAEDAGAEIVTGERLRGINFEKRFAMFSSLSVSYDYLVWTLPLPLLMDKSDPDRSLFLSNRVRTMGIGLKELYGGSFTWAYPDVKAPAHRVTLLSRYHKQNAPPGKDSLLIEFPYRLGYRGLPLYLADANPEDPYLRHSESNKNRAIRALSDIGFDDNLDIDVVVTGDTAGYPIPTRRVREVVADVKDTLLKHNVITAGRWGSWGYFNTEHCFRDAAVAADAIRLRDDEPHRYMAEYLMSSFYYRVYEEAANWPTKLNSKKLVSAMFSGRW